MIPPYLDQPLLPLAVAPPEAVPPRAPVADQDRSDSPPSGPAPSFAFHLNEMSGPGRGNVLRKRGARRTYQYNFAEPAMQPFVIMKSLKDGIISRTLFEQFYVKRQGSLSI